jgi:hypothetical protein
MNLHKIKANFIFDFSTTRQNNHLLTYDSYVPLYNRFHRGEWITRVSGGEGAHSWASLVPFGPMKSIIHGHIRISGQ